MKKSINIGLLGFGTVASSFYHIFSEQKNEIDDLFSVPVNVKKIYTRGRSHPVPENIKKLLVKSAGDIIDDKEIDVVIELIGGIEPAKDIILQAIAGGKNIITANKALLAEHGEEIFKKASEKKVHIGFEAAVGGGIPILRSIKNGLAGDEIKSVYSIINGTSNFILSKMTNEGGKFEDVLKKAQEKGYAEADPSLDINGTDSAHKLAILGRLAFSTSLSMDDIIIEGIENISQLDISFAKELGYIIKLLGILKNEDSKIEIRVHPTLIPYSSIISKVDGVFNAFLVNTKFAGPLSLTGYGAGGNPTAGAVMGDLVETISGIINGESRRDFIMSKIKNKLNIKTKKDIISRYYLRFSAMDRPGVLSKISGILGENSISISSMIQKGRKVEGSVPIVITTHEANEAELLKSIEKCDKLDVITAKTMVLRIEDKIE
jgi:homoserine dehydrogenase